MSSISRDDLRETIRFRGDYKNVRKFATADLNAEIQKAFGSFYQIVEECNEGWWDKQGDISTVAGQAYVALPSDCWIVKAIDRMDGGEPTPMAEVGIQARNRYGTTQGQPVAYRPSSRGIELYRTPNAIYTLRVTYSPLAPELGSAREWYNGWDDYVIEKVLFELAKREKMPLQDHITALQAAEAKLRSGATKRGQQEPDYLVLREATPGDPYDDGVL